MTENDIKFEKIDELENSEKEAPQKEASLEILKDTNKSRKKQESESKTPEEIKDRRIERIAAVLIVIVIIAALVPLLMMKATKIKNERAEKESIEESEAQSLYESSVAESQFQDLLKEESGRKLSKTEIPELNMLVNDYFDARLRADSEKMLSIYGRKDHSADEEWTAKLTAQASWVKGFENIVRYDMEGTCEDERFCIVTYEVDFRRTNINAPGIMYFFAKKTDDGYIIEENLMSEEVAFLERQLQRQDVKNLIEETDRRLKSKLDENSTLALIYTSFINGEIYKEPNIDISKEQSVDLFTDPEDSVLIDQ